MTRVDADVRMGLVLAVLMFSAGALTGLLSWRPSPAPLVHCQLALEAAPDTVALLIDPADVRQACRPYWHLKLLSSGFTGATDSVEVAP